MIRYLTITKRDDEHRIWYGAAAMQDGHVCERRDELSTDREAVMRLITRLNDGNASLIHFTEIIDDFMAQPAAF